MKLLPYIREDVYGLDSSSSQTLGWEITKFNIPQKWTLSQGEGVTVAVIDTGCDLYHDDIKKNLVQGYNFVELSKDPIDKNGHGTHVSSTIAAENNNTGIVGVAPKVKIMPIKALDDKGNSPLQRIVDAIIWASDQKADFITMSLGAPTGHNKLHKAIKHATRKGSVIFCAAGNSGPANDITFPARYPETISIGAIDRNLNRTNFTCSGEELDFLAPGHDILGAVPGNKYALMSGTSMANPFAVGCASLLLGYIRTHRLELLPLKALDYINIFKQTAIGLTDVSHKGVKKYEGYGIITPEWRLD